jgi:DNA modification methylase
MGIPTSPLHFSALICKSLTVQAVNSEYCKKHKHAKPTFNKHCRFEITDKDEQGKSLHYRDMSSVWYFKQEPRRGRHKHLTKLPDALVSKMLAYSSHENDVIADFFLGSGTTAFQAHTMKRRVIGFEKNP